MVVRLGRSSPLVCTLKSSFPLLTRTTGISLLAPLEVERRLTAKTVTETDPTNTAAAQKLRRSIIVSLSAPRWDPPVLCDLPPLSPFLQGLVPQRASQSLPHVPRTLIRLACRQ